MAKSYLLAQQPKVLHIDLADTDNYGHSGNYGRYLDAAHFVDKMVANLWEIIENQPKYKGKTAVLVYPDHGRGVNEKWTGHGTGSPRSDDTWLVALGPGIPAMGEVSRTGQIYQDQIAQTAAKLLGFTFKANHPVGESIRSILK